MEWLRRRQRSGPADKSSSHDAEGTARSPDDHDPNPPRGTDFNDPSRGVPLRGHSFKNVDARGQSRLHLGDNITVHNHGPPPTEEAINAERMREFMSALEFDQMWFRRENVSQAHAQTCQWIFREEEYQRWRDPALRVSHHGFFWIKGKPGSGKSTTMKCILEHLQTKSPGSTIVSFFFNARGVALEKTMQGCYRSLLHQLLEQVPQVRSSIHIPASFSEGQEWVVSNLQSFIRKAVLAAQGTHLILVIDALDECDEDEVRDMVDFMNGLAQSAKLLDACFASRHYPRITIRYCEELVIEEFAAHASDILDYTVSKLNIPSEEHTLRNRLIQEISHRARGIFLWAVLVVRMANKQFDRGDTYSQLLATVESLPDGLDALFARIVRDGAEDVHFLPAMLWVLVQRDPSRVNKGMETLYYGIKLGAGTLTSPLRDSSLSNSTTMERFIVHASKGLVECTKGRYQVQFIHESVRQYILAGNLADISPRLSCNVEAESHALVAEWCIAYPKMRLPSSTNLPTDPVNGQLAWEKMVPLPDKDCYENDTYANINRIQDDFPLLNYIHYCTFHHLNAAYLGGACYLGLLQNFPLQEWLRLSTLHNLCTSSLGADAYHPSASLLHLLLDAGSSMIYAAGIATGLLKQYHSLLHATGTADQHMFEIIFGKDLNDYCGGENGTPLVAAADAQSRTAVELLLNIGADVNHHARNIDASGNLHGRDLSPLAAAVDSASRRSSGALGIDIIELLLNRGANINAQGIFGSALGCAVSQENTKVAELLLARGADASLEDSTGYNIALKRAISPRLGHDSQEMMQLLLTHGACARLHSADRALHMAAQKCKEAYIKLFLEQAGADPNGRDLNGRTSLHLVSEGEFKMGYRSPEMQRLRASCAKALLSHGADVNAIGGDYDTPLIAASAKGFAWTVAILLVHGANPYHCSKKHGNAVDAARTAGHQDIVEMLVQVVILCTSVTGSGEHFITSYQTPDGLETLLPDPT